MVGRRRPGCGIVGAVPEPSTVVAALRAAGCVFAEDEAELLLAAPAPPAEVDALVARRVAGEPLEYVLGWVAFAGLRVPVDPGVFVPRRRTELLVEQAVAVLRAGAAGRDGGAGRDGAVVVDLCCGCGAVGLAIATALPGTDLHAADVDPVSVANARRALAPVGGRVYAGDLDAPLPAALRGRVDVLVANAPYVPTGAIDLMPPEARLHEPLPALDGGADGLAVLRRVVAAAPGWLAPGGHLLVETGRAQVPALAAAVTAAGLLPRVTVDDDRSATVLTAARP